MVVIAPLNPITVSLPEIVDPIGIPPGPSIPFPDTVPLDVYPAVDKGRDVTFWQRGLVGWVNFTHLVRSADWRIGEFRPNRIGGLMGPTNGAILMSDFDGEFSVLNPNDRYSPYPGVPVEIRQGLTRGDRLLFKGFSSGVLNSATVVDETSAMPIYSSLQRLAEFGDGFHLGLDGQLVTHEIIRGILNQSEEAFATNLEDGGVEVYTTLLGKNSAISSGRGRAQFLDALHLVATLEGGRIYDDQEGVIQFENYKKRLVAPSTVKRIANAQAVLTKAQDSMVVNIIQGKTQGFESQGFKDLEFKQTLPLQVIVPPNTFDWDVGLELADEDIFFVESWGGINPGDHYLWSVVNPEYRPVLLRGDRSCRIRFSNPTSFNQVAVIIRVEGQPFKSTLAKNFILRDAESIRRFGPKAVNLQTEIMVDQPAMRGRMQRYLEFYKGIAESGNIDPLITLEVRLRDPAEIYSISDLVLLTWKGLRKVHAREHPFWVEAVDYSYVSEGHLDVRLTLVDAWHGEVRRGAPRRPGDPYAPVSMGKIYSAQEIITLESMGQIFVIQSMGRLNAVPNISMGQLHSPISMGQISPGEISYARIPMGRLHALESMGQLYPVESMGSLHALGAMGRLHPVESMGQVHVPRTMGSLRALQSMGQVHDPKSMGKIVSPVSMGRVYSPISMGRVVSVESMGRVYSRLSMGTLQVINSMGQIRGPIHILTVTRADQQIQPPVSPAVVNFIARDFTELDFDWPVSTSADVIWYEYQLRRQGHVDWSAIFRTTGTTASFTGLELSQAYDIRVRAVSFGGMWSDWRMGVGVTGYPIETPRNVRVGTRTEMSLQFIWISQVSASYGWQFREIETFGWSAEQTIISSAVTIQLSAGRTYEFRVRTLGVHGLPDSDYAVTSGTTLTLVTTLPAPTNFRVTSQTGSHITWDWDSYPNAVQYTWEQYVGNTRTQTGTVTGSSLTLSFPANFTAGLRVRAVTDDFSAWTPIVRGTTS